MFNKKKELEKEIIQLKKTIANQSNHLKIADTEHSKLLDETIELIGDVRVLTKTLLSEKTRREEAEKAKRKYQDKLRRAEETHSSIGSVYIEVLKDRVDRVKVSKETNIIIVDKTAKNVEHYTENNLTSSIELLALTNKYMEEYKTE